MPEARATHRAGNARLLGALCPCTPALCLRTEVAAGGQGVRRSGPGAPPRLAPGVKTVAGMGT